MPKWLKPAVRHGPKQRRTQTCEKNTHMMHLTGQAQRCGVPGARQGWGGQKREHKARYTSLTQRPWLDCAKKPFDISRTTKGSPNQPYSKHTRRGTGLVSLLRAAKVTSTDEAHPAKTNGRIGSQLRDAKHSVSHWMCQIRERQIRGSGEESQACIRRLFQAEGQVTGKSPS